MSQNSTYFWLLMENNAIMLELEYDLKWKLYSWKTC